MYIHVPTASCLRRGAEERVAARLAAGSHLTSGPPRVLRKLNYRAHYDSEVKSMLERVLYRGLFAVLLVFFVRGGVESFTRVLGRGSEFAVHSGGNLSQVFLCFEGSLL